MSRFGGVALGFLLSFVVPATAQVHNRAYWESFNQACYEASMRIRDGNCGHKTDCDCALKMVLDAGCRIQFWGHWPRCIHGEPRIDNDE